MSILEKYTNQHSRFAVIDGSLVHYRDEGQGPCLLLLHGAFSSLHTFDDWTSKLTSQFRVIRIDLPGFGLTGKLNSGKYEIAYVVKFIKTFLEVVKVDQFYLVGSSLGGWISWEMALAYPDKVKKLILIDAAGFLDSKNIPLPFKMARTPFMNKIVKFAINRSMLENFLRDVYYNRSKISDALVDRYYDLFSKEGNPEAFFSLVNQRFVDHTRFLKEIKIPVLILWGQEDIWLPVENAYRFHDKIPNNEMIIYERTGHVPMEEIPWDTVEDVISFLNEK